MNQKELPRPVGRQFSSSASPHCCYFERLIAFSFLRRPHVVHLPETDEMTDEAFWLSALFAMRPLGQEGQSAEV